MVEPDSADDDRSFEWNTEKGVGPSGMMLEGSDGAVDGPEDVEVRGFGCEHHGDGGVGCLAVEACAGEADSGHEMGYGIHSVRNAFFEVNLRLELVLDRSGRSRADCRRCGRAGASCEPP